MESPVRSVSFVTEDMEEIKCRKRMVLWEAKVPTKGELDSISTSTKEFLCDPVYIS